MFLCLDWSVIHKSSSRKCH